MKKLNKKPNILFLFTDQLRWDFLGFAGAYFLKTPNLDRLASQSINFTRCYSEHPRCVPARASLLTGMHAFKTGVLSNKDWIRPDYHNAGIRTWPERLSEVGYQTAAIGKMHFYPWDERMGFHFRSITEDKRWTLVRDDYYHFLKKNGTRKFKGIEHENYLETKGAIFSRNPWELSWDHFVGSEAVDYLNHHHDEEPFAMMVSFPGPHCPYDPNEESIEGINLEEIPDAINSVADDCPLFKAKNHDGNKGDWNGVDLSDCTPEQKRKIRQHYAALVQQIDLEVGRILDTLETIGKMDDTLIIFSSDHGDYLGDHDMMGKGSFYEGSCHVPLLVRDPKQPKQETCDELVALTDITATILAYAGVEIPDSLDSIPLPKIDYTHFKFPHKSHRNKIIGVLSDASMYLEWPWKYSKYSTGEITLFNLERDPSEVENLAENPEYISILLRCEKEWTKECLPLIHSGHRDKSLDPVAFNAASPAFAYESFPRTYPRPW